MSDPNVQSWRQRGHIFLWRDPEETRNWPGWNFSADPEGLHSITELLDHMLHAKWSAKANIATNTIAPPIPARSAKILQPGQWTLTLPLGKVADSHWLWSGTPSHPVLTLGPGKLTELQKSLHLLASGNDDFCIHADDQPKHGITPGLLSIWFWSIG